MPLTTTPSERIGRCTRMRRFIVRFNRPESFVHTRSSAGFTIITSGFEFSVHAGTRTAPFPANVRASCGARFLVAFPKIARRLAFSSKRNCQTIDASSDLASKDPGCSQLSHGDARLAWCFKSSAKRETIGPKSDNEARTRGNKRPENCSFVVKSIAGAQATAFA